MNFIYIAQRGGMLVIDEDAKAASAALASFLQAFARLIAEEVRRQPLRAIPSLGPF
jgi:hypothetical protein